MTDRRSILIPILLALIVVALAGIGNEIRYQGCISRQTAELQMYLAGHKAILPVQCHRL